MQTIIARSLKSLKKNLVIIEKKKRIGLVPTMGSLHEGHLELIKKTKKLNDITIVSIFLNPIQFNSKKDLIDYPSQEKKDIKLLKKQNVEIIFIPKAEQIYPPDFSTYLIEKNYSNLLCGKYRQKHFSGVITIVLKLFFLIRPYSACFGEKDFQQLFIIKKIIKDLNIDIKIFSIPTIRDKYGLAYSSRNNLLSKNNLIIARKIYYNLKRIDYKMFRGTEEMIESLKKELYKIGVKDIEYLEIRESNTLKKLVRINKKKEARVYLALRLGRVRLIDNYKIC